MQMHFGLHTAAMPTMWWYDMTTLYSDITDNDIDLLTTQAIPVACRTRTSPGYTTFTGIALGRAHYRDVTAKCRCQDVHLLRTGFYLYSNCKQHGMVALDQLVRETGANGRPA